MNTISESIPIELVREIIRKRNELSDETFQIHINQKGEQYISLNRSSKYVKSVTKSLETMADCLRHHSQLTYLLKYAPEWDYRTRRSRMRSLGPRIRNASEGFSKELGVKLIWK